MMVLLLLLSFEVEARINPYGPTVVSDLTNCMEQLIEFNFKQPGLIIFANTNNVSTSVARIRTKLLKEISIKLKFSIQVKSPRNEPALCSDDDENENLKEVHVDTFEAIPLADYFIIIVDTYKDFQRVAARIVRSRNWNPYAKIIVLFFNFVSNDNLNANLVEKMLTCIFRHNVVNVVVVVPQSNNIRNSIIYGWRPFDPPKYCGHFNETAENRLLIENTCELGVVKHRKDIFEGRIPKSMQGCILEILALQRQPFVSVDADDPNIERYFINQLAEIYDFKTVYKISGAIRGDKDEEGNWGGAINMLEAKNGHILLGGIFPDSDIHEDFECSLSYLADSYAWVVPRAFQSPKYIALFIIFKDIVWYCVIAVFFLIVISWYVLGYLSKDTLYHRTFSHCFLNTWISHVGFCAYARPVKQSLRVFYVFFNIYCILFLTCYTTKLIDVLKNPTFEEQIDSIEELVDSGLKFGGFEELHDLYFNSSDPFDYLIGKQWYDIENITEALIDVAVHRNFSVLCSRMELDYLSSIIPELSDSSGDYKYFAFEQNTFTISVEMVSLKGFAFMNEFSDVLEKFKQMGVSSSVRTYFSHLNLRKRAMLLRSLGEFPEVNPLSLQHLQGGFIALALGYITGSLALFVENIVNSKYVKSKITQLFNKMKIK